MTDSVYVHVPFCEHICQYCAFFRQADDPARRKQWLTKLCESVRQQEFPDSLETLYFGGGTPSVLSVEEISQLRTCFPKVIRECTIEINPESLTPEKAAAYFCLGINRASIGVQSFHDDMLASIGRRHTADQARSAIGMLRAAGITNISIDLLYGLPGQSLEDVKEDVEQFLRLDLDHLSIYSLQIEENSAFGRKGIPPCDEDLEADMYEWICLRLKQAGYDHYEISSFARHGKYSRHNLTYWQDEDFMGLGPGAAGRQQGQRYHIDQNWEKVCDETDGPFEAVMMGLRTRFGIDLVQYEKRYGFDLMNRYRDVIDRWSTFFRTGNGRLYLTEQGREVLNTILLDFMD